MKFSQGILYLVFLLVANRCCNYHYGSVTSCEGFDMYSCVVVCVSGVRSCCWFHEFVGFVRFWFANCDGDLLDGSWAQFAHVLSSVYSVARSVVCFFVSLFLRLCKPMSLLTSSYSFIWLFNRSRSFVLLFARPFVRSFWRSHVSLLNVLFVQCLRTPARPVCWFVGLLVCCFVGLLVCLFACLFVRSCECLFFVCLFVCFFAPVYCLFFRLLVCRFVFFVNCNDMFT